MSEVTIPLGLLLLGTGAMLWQAVRADRQRNRAASHPPATPPPSAENDHGAQKG